MKQVIVALLIFAGVGVVLFLIAWISIRSTVHNPIPPGPIAGEILPATPETISFKSGDGNKLSGWYFNKEDAKAVIIVIHGLSTTVGGKSDMTGLIPFLSDAGYSLFLIDLRGFGESEFRNISFATQEWKDAAAAYDVMKKRAENRGRKIGFLGHSMGGATAVITQGKTGKGDFVIANVPFATPGRFLKQQIVARGLPPAVFNPFLQAAARLELGPEVDQVTAERYAKDVSVPTLVIGGKRDIAVNPQDPQDIYKAIPSRKELWMADTGHNPYLEDTRGFTSHVLNFLARVDR